MTDKNDFSKAPQFLVVFEHGGVRALVNLDQVSMIDQIHNGSCRLIFAPDFSLTITGSGADELFSFLMVRGTSVDGRPMAEILKKHLESQPKKD